MDRIAYDIDCTMVDSSRHWHEYFTKNRSMCRAPGGPHNYTAVHDHVLSYDHFGKWCDTCFHDVLVTPDVVEGHPLRPGAAQFITDVSRECVQDIVTSRKPARAHITANWLSNVGVSHLIGRVHYTSDKRAICEAHGVSVLIDDSPEVAEQFLQGPRSSCVLVLFDAPYNRHLPFPRITHFDQLRLMLPRALEKARSLRRMDVRNLPIVRKDQKLELARW